MKIMRDFANVCLAFLKRDFLIEKSYRFSFTVQILDGILKVGIFYFISGFLSADYFSFVFAGLIFSRFFQFFLGVFTNFIKQEQYWGTIEPLFSAPGGHGMIFTAAFFGKFVFFFAEIIVYLLIGFFSVYKVPFIRVVLFAVVVCFTALFFAAFGLISAGFVLKFKKGDPVNWFFSGIIDVFSGVYFPIGYLPGILNKVAAVLPTTFVLNIWRDVLSGGGISFGRILYFCAASAAFFLAAVLFFNRCWSASKKRGDIGYY